MSSSKTCEQRVTYTEEGLSQVSLLLGVVSSECAQIYILLSSNPRVLLERRYSVNPQESRLLWMDAESWIVSQKVTWFPFFSPSLVVMSLEDHDWSQL